jgi:hypothetical protein
MYARGSASSAVTVIAQLHFVQHKNTASLAILPQAVVTPLQNVNSALPHTSYLRIPITYSLILCMVVWSNNNVYAELYSLIIMLYVIPIKGSL